MNARNMFFRCCFVLMAIVGMSELAAQNSYFPTDFPEVKIGGRSLAYAWSGGLNNPQFSAADLNNDGLDDLFIFDRAGNGKLTFINHGASGQVDYTYEPQFAANFPEMHAWGLLKDFNCDDIPDLFTYAPGVIKAYKGYYDLAGHLQFTVFLERLEFASPSGFVPIPVNEVDIPAFVDIDEDGDLDILGTSQFGSAIVFYENFSKQHGYGCDTMFFDDSDQCWGKFLENGVRPSVQLGYNCKQGSGKRHIGTTLLAFDADGDYDKDLILGDVSFNNFIFLTNGGDTTSAEMVSQDSLFPVNSTPAAIHIFPAAFLADVNNDGLDDILGSPNHLDNPLDKSVNYRNVWWYKNDGTTDSAIFNFQTDTFLTMDMMEFGSGAYPAFVDYNGDNHMDLVVGNTGYLDFSDTSLTAQLGLYINTGSDTMPVYELADRDFANIKSLDLESVTPTFGDLDDDGDQDMIIGDITGSIHYFENTAGAGNPIVFAAPQLNYQGISAGQFSAPQIVDANLDQLLDLVIGKKDGTLSYYQNTGTKASPVFSLLTAQLGGVDVRQTGFATGYSVPHLVDLEGGGKLSLLVGSERGTIYYYIDIDNLGGNFTLRDTFYSAIDVGGHSSIIAGDLNDDGDKELIVGNARGGLSLFHHAPPMAKFTFESICLGDSVLFSNQTLGAESYQWFVYNSLGKAIDSSILMHPIFSFDSLGVYFVSLTAANSFGSDHSTQSVPVTQAPPQVDFSFTIDKSTVEFINLSEYATSYTWAFGDGLSDTTVSDTVLHTYSVDSSYTVTLSGTNTCGSDTASQTLIISDPSITPATFRRFEVRILPNPNAGTFELVIRSDFRKEDLDIRLFDMNGKAVFQEKLSIAGRYTRRVFDQNDLAPGVYYLQLRSGHRIVHKKMVKY